MIHSARLRVLQAATIVFCCIVLLDLKSTEGRTDGRTCGKIMITTGRDCGLAEWINTSFGFSLLFIFVRMVCLSQMISLHKNIYYLQIFTIIANNCKAYIHLCCVICNNIWKSELWLHVKSPVLSICSFIYYFSHSPIQWPRRNYFSLPKQI